MSAKRARLKHGCVTFTTHQGGVVDPIDALLQEVQEEHELDVLDARDALILKELIKPIDRLLDRADARRSEALDLDALAAQIRRRFNKKLTGAFLARLLMRPAGQLGGEK